MAMLIAGFARADSVKGPVKHQLRQAPGLWRLNDGGINTWGTATMLQAIEHVATRIAVLRPDLDPLYIGDISRKGGGPLFPHKTHDKGIDVDIGLFTHGGRQPGFVDLGPEQLDLEANWLLVTEFVNTGLVNYILLDQAHIDALRAYALDELELPLSWVDDVCPSDARRQPWKERGAVRHIENHRSHIHVRTHR